jgi:hypothetical protein
MCRSGLPRTVGPPSGGDGGACWWRGKRRDGGGAVASPSAESAVTSLGGDGDIELGVGGLSGPQPRVADGQCRRGGPRRQSEVVIQIGVEGGETCGRVACSTSVHKRPHRETKSVSSCVRLLPHEINMNRKPLLEQ